LKEIRLDPEKIRKELAAAQSIQPHFWQGWEDDLLREFYGKRDPGLLAEKLGRSRKSIQTRAGELGLTHKK
jgi:hypothetical protein